MAEGWQRWQKKLRNTYTDNLALEEKKSVLIAMAQSLSECFETTQDPKLGVYMSSAAIFERVRKKAGSSLAVGNLSKFGQFLSNIDGIVRRRVKTGTQYLVIPIEK